MIVNRMEKRFILELTEHQACTIKWIIDEIQNDRKIDLNNGKAGDFANDLQMALFGAGR